MSLIAPRQEAHWWIDDRLTVGRHERWHERQKSNHSNFTLPYLDGNVGPPGLRQLRPRQRPNDQPDQASSFDGDCGSGSLGDEDGQDLWLWNVTDAASLRELRVPASPMR